MHPRIFLSPPDVGVREKNLVINALESGWVAPIGPDLNSFEAEVARICGRQFGVGLSSGTAALHLSLLAAGVKPGDVVVCSTMTFVATANAISYIGAIPVFIDSDETTGNMSVALLERALRTLESDGRRVAAVMPVDFLGKAVNYSAIMQLCDERGIPVVADSAESLGAFHNGKPAGSFGVAAAVSFNGNKIATTSSGGMVLTDDVELANRVRHLATQAREPVVHYEHVDLGYNYRLSNILAALGRAQIERLPAMISIRRKWREKYRELFATTPEVTVFGGDDAEDNCWLTAIIVSSEASWAPSDFQEFLETRNIESRPLWKPMHLQPLYRHCESFVDGTSERLFDRGLTLPSGSSMSPAEWTRIDTAISEFLQDPTIGKPSS
jgi:dTDP-4-amino-4,6-dideoxygalactose transaminase